MTVTVDDLRGLVNTSIEDDSVLTQCLEFGEELVKRYVSRVSPGSIPPTVLNEAVLVAAADQFNRRKAPNGVLNQQFDDGAPVRVSRDPLVSVRPILASWVNRRGAGSVYLGQRY